MERLQKVLSMCGVASRRKAEDMIVDGRVRVNGIVMLTLGCKVDIMKDVISVDGKKIAKPAKVYYLFNKPKGTITSTTDPEGRKIVMDYFRDVPERVYPVGRLDQNTEGLLLMTNDGELANILMHPSKEVDKTYAVKVKGRLTDKMLELLAKGVMLEDGMTAPATVVDLGFDKQNDLTSVEITIHEGRNREVRRMFEFFGLQVHNLKRVRYGSLSLSGMKRGSYRPLTRDEIVALYKYK